ncbi:MAG: gliding motility-associated C-terminal domain-containing protein [Niastella sp.]|nr:gliding motility-associated C-terminal domain-containing protein [Niastella sp.]
MFLYFLPAGTTAQVCVSDYFHIGYTTPTVQNMQHVVLTSNNELLLAGDVMRPNSVLLDGWLSLLSIHGTVLWSRRYTSPIYNYVRFSKAVPSGDGGYIATGSIGNVDTTKVPPATLTQLGFVMKVDKHGNIIWSRIFVKTFVAEKVVDIPSIIATKDGDFVIATNYAAAVNSANIVLRITKDGVIKWTTRLYADARGAGYSGMQMTQLRNGDIVLGNMIRLFDVSRPFVTEHEGYYTVSMDDESGLINWERLYSWKGPPPTRERVFGPIVQITELPFGGLSIIASQADTAYIYFRKTTRVINMITDNIGNLKQAFGYQSNQPPVYASAAVPVGNAGDQVLLMDNADAPSLLYINAAGAIQWQKSYPLTGRSQETKDLFATPNGFYFFSFTHNGGSTDLKLVKTDPSGTATCVEGPHTMSATDITSYFVQVPFNLDVDISPANLHSIIALSMVDYRIDASIICRKSCCEDKTDTAALRELCNASSYTLPNNDVVTAAGTYSITYTSAKGCDSIVYYPVSFPKSPSVDLGRDECLEGKDSLVLKTAPGYASYNWMGEVSNSPSYVVKRPGQYWVSVSNACATKVDSIAVYQDCAFEIRMPNIFTPNGDRNNDVFRIPLLNKNRLISLRIYNRYGEQVFYSTDIRRGWDGTFRSIPQPSGTYVYLLEMETLNGRGMVQKGVVTLVR